MLVETKPKMDVPLSENEMDVVANVDVLDTLAAGACSDEHVALS